MANWLNKNILREKISVTEKINLYEDIRNLKEDLEFFNLYIKRNKKSNFDFQISFSKGMAKNFLTHLYVNSYSYTIDDLESLYIEFLVVRHFFRTLNNEEDMVVYTDNDLKDIYNHFVNVHEIRLEDYISDFIGCSRSCEYVKKEMNKLFIKED